MARGKKGEVLTLEERLQAALVPESEQPYRVPGNWCWTRMQNVAQWGSGGTPSRKIPGYYEGSIPWLKTGELNDDYIFETEEHITRDAVFNSSAKLFPVNTVAIAMYGATIGKVGILGVEATTNQACACGVAYPIINFKYLFYYARSQKNIFINQGKGGAQPNISQEVIKSHPIPLSPLPEQRRIVDRIESLFAKLDEAKQKAQDALDSFETRKAAILHKAFTGELTSQWRKEHGVRIESWVKKRFDEVATIRSNLVNPTDFPDFPHIAPDNIEKKTGVLLKYHTIAEDGVTSGKHRFYPGQILYSKIRPYLSKVVVVDFDGLCSADMYPIEAKEDAKCLWYYMLSEEFVEQASTAGSRSVLPKINQKELSALTVKLPTSGDEQNEIVRILDSLFDKEQQAKEAAEGVLEQIDFIKKSILARAFRGELGTNDPAEESSLELIKQTLSETITNNNILELRTIDRIEVEFMPKTIIEALADGTRLTPEDLKAKTGLQIDDFYEQLKTLIDKKQIIETRIDGESYLEATHADRQTEN